MSAEAGEEAAIPRIASEAMSHAFSPLAIEVRTLGGVGEFTGKKKYEKLGALAKFIDDYHYRQTQIFSSKPCGTVASKLR